ncbi:MAG: hypothetical protein WHS46_01120 [Desulfosoma sp.]
MFTKLVFLRILLPLALVVIALGLAPFGWAKRLRAKIRFAILLRRFLIAFVCLAVLAYGVDYVVNKLIRDKEESQIQRQGGRTGTLPPPIHGRPLHSP